MKQIARALGVLLVVVLALGALAPSATAGQRIQRESDEPAIASAFDITDIRYINGEKLLSAEVFVRDLQDVDTRVQLRFNTGPLRVFHGVFIVTAIRAAGGYKAISDVKKQRGRTTPLSCAGLKIKWNLTRSTVTVQVPQRCLGDATGKQRLVTRIGEPERFVDKTDPFFVKYR